MPVAPAGNAEQPRPSRFAVAGRSLAALARACHPEPTAAVTAISLAYAIAGGAGRRAPLVAGAVLAQQLSIGWSNDALDATRDRADHRPDKPLAAGALSPRAVLWAATVALAASVPLSRAAATGHAGSGSGIGNLLCAASGWAYNIGLKATVASPLPYLTGFGGLAAFLDSARPGPARPAPRVVVAGALLGAAAHVANVLPDIDDDLAHGIAGLPQRLGARRSRQLYAVLLSGAGIVVAGPPAGRRRSARDGWSGVVGSVGRATATALPAVALTLVARHESTGSRNAFRMVLAVAGLDVALLLRRARR